MFIGIFTSSGFSPYQAFVARSSPLGCNWVAVDVRFVRRSMLPALGKISRGGPIALILSDGWDCGDPELLRLEIARLARSVHSIIWLNPLAAHAEYRPATRGMQAVLPHVDHLLPAASVMDLRGVVRLLDSMRR